jgi:hypothetical protein
MALPIAFQVAAIEGIVIHEGAQTSEDFLVLSEETSKILDANRSIVSI